jgi:hypothetical protein
MKNILALKVLIVRIVLIMLRGMAVKTKQYFLWYF